MQPGLGVLVAHKDYDAVQVIETRRVSGHEGQQR